VKEIAMYRGDIAKFVPEAVAAQVARRVEQLGRKGA
jgi:pantetheine-phosphate adenylyltransferase